MKTISGKAQNIKEPVLGVITYNPFSFKKDKILLAANSPIFSCGIKAIITSNLLKYKLSGIYDVAKEHINSIKQGDIVNLNANGTVHVLWENNSLHNAIFITDYCNSKCIMCPQVNQNYPSNYFDLNKKILELVDSNKVCNIGITGGEPTLDMKSLISVIKTCKEKFSKASISLLTNGKLFSDINILKQITSIKHPNITFCIPLYSDIDIEHNYIVGAPNSFNDTIYGLHNLAKLSQKVEIRIVIIRQNYEKLKSLSEFIYRNLPFASHIAFMDMECTGLAKDNLDKIWVDPVSYSEQLSNAILHLRQRDMNVSIYNLPKCLLPSHLWEYARDSISSWKKTFLDQCKNCLEKDNCSGIFATSTHNSENIRAISG